MSRRPDGQQEIDWYGERAKRKNRRSSRRATGRGLALGVLVTIIVAAAIVLKWRDNLRLVSPLPTATPLNWPLISPYITVTVAPDVQRAQHEAALTATAIFAPTVTPFMIAAASATSAPTSTPIPLPDRIATYLLIGGGLYPVQTLPIAAEPGYQFTALAIGADKAIEVAYARTPDSNVACDPNEAIWHILPDYKTIQHWPLPTIGHPKALVSDPQGGATLIAFDCQHHMWTIVRITADGQPIGVPFAIVGGAALATSTDGQVLIGLSGFADQAARQPHILTLRVDPLNNTLIQQAESYTNDVQGSYFTALKFDPVDATRLFAIWHVPDRSDQVIVFRVPSIVTPTPNSSTLTVTQAIGLSAIETPTEVPIASGLTLHDVANNRPVQLIGLDFINGLPIGLRADGRALLTWDATGQVTTLPVPNMVARAMAIDPTSGLIYLAGQPNDTQ